MRFKAAGRAKARSIPAVSMLAVVVGVLAVTGCGSSSTSSSSSTPPSSSAASTPTTSSSATSSTPAPAAGGGGQTLSLATNPGGQLKFDKTSLTAKSGKVSIAYTNMAPLGHNLTVESSSGAVLGATETFQGGSKTLSLNLKPGTYKFFCTVPGHRAAGMEGTLTVR